MQNEMRTVLQTTDVESHLKMPAKPLTEVELLQDYNYFMAQRVAKAMFDKELISLEEFNKLTKKNRDTFSPFLAEIMPKTT
nr:MAG TPA: hypothetical protein [Caudoviricetes sp.]